MPVRKIAISVHEDVLETVDRAAAERGLTRSRFITQVLARVSRAKNEREILREINAVFADPEIAREQRRTTRALMRLRPKEGAEW